jgi:hypothetical protein
MLGSRDGLAGGRRSAFARGQNAPEIQVGGGKGVGFAQQARRNILRRGAIHAADGLQAANGLFEAAMRAEEIWVGDHGGR